MPALSMPRQRIAGCQWRPPGYAVTNYCSVLQKRSQEPQISEYWLSLPFDQAQGQLQELAGLSPNWDSYGAEAPNEQARNTAKRVLTLLRSMSVPPTRIVASAEGGVGICFAREDLYADFECFNTGEIVAVRYRGSGEPVAWEVQPEDEAIKTAIEQIRAHFSA